jgi:membrane-associated phospholipid phosphatase
MMSRARPGATSTLLERERERPPGRDGDGRPASTVPDRGLRTWPFRGRSLKIWFGAWAGMTVVLTLVGLLITEVLDDGPLGRLDRSIAFWFEDRRTPTWNSLSQIGAGLADAYTLTPAVIILTFALAAIFKRWHESAVLAGGILLEKAVFLPTTHLVGRERPPVPQLDGNPPTSSFPSGHVAAAVVAYGAIGLIILWHTRRRWLRFLAMAFASVPPTLVLLSRLELGMHHFSDVIVGAIAGGAALLFATWAVRAGTDEIRAKGAGDHQGVLDPALQGSAAGVRR